MFLLCAALLGCSSTQASPQVEVAPVLGGVHAAVSAGFEEQGLVGLAVAIVHEDQITELTFGFADREEKVPVSGDTLFRWASISKPLTAIAAMQLVEAGRLDLDKDVRDYVPEFPEKPWPITSRQLMQHRGGVVHYRNGPVVRTEGIEYEAEHPFADTVTALDLFKDSPLVAEPGTKHAYSTHGYMLLGAVVQRAGRAPFHQQVEKRIARPLGMTTLRPDYQWESMEHRAIGYLKLGEDIRRSPDTDVSWKLPGGGYLSTIGDLARFARGVANGETLSAKSWTAMFTPQVAPETEAGHVQYGLGFGINRKGDELRVSHSGSQWKTRTLCQVKPGSKRAVVLMTNSEWADLAPIAAAVWEALAVKDTK